MVIAGAGHDHGSHSHDPVSKSQAEEAAIKSVEKLVSKRKIADSWKGVKVATSEKKKFGTKEEWVVTFKNEKVSDPNKQTLYVFLTLTGDYIAANFTGQ
jgi:hypothetical protein